MKITIKTIPRDDLRVAVKFASNVLGRLGRTPQYILRHYKKNPELFLGAYSGDRLVGILFGYKIRNKVLIGELAIDKKHRRKGIGRKLIKELVCRAKELGAKEIIVGAVEGAEGFYARVEFRPYLFVQVMKDELPENFRNLGFRVLKISKRGNSVGLLLVSDEINSAEKKKDRSYLSICGKI